MHTTSNLKSPIAYVVKYYPRFSETFIVNEILAHEKAGHEVVIFSLKPSTATHFQNIISEVKAPVYYLQKTSFTAESLWSQLRTCAQYIDKFWDRLAKVQWADDPVSVHQALCLAQQLEQLNVQHVHTHFLGKAAVVTQIASILTQIPFTATAHAKDIFHESVDPMKIQSLLNEARALVTVSDFNLNYLRERYACPASLVKIYNGMDLNRFQFRERSGDGPILAVGRLVEKKGFQVLIQACAMLKSQGIAFQCHIVGDGPYGAELKKLVQSLELDDRIQFLGSRPLHEVMERIAQATMLVAPSVVAEDGDRDGLPTVLLEAGAIGTPCVASDVTGIPEVIEHEKSGLISPAGDAQALAMTVARLLRDRELGTTLAKNARLTIETHFSVDKNAAALRKLFFRKADGQVAT